jgi:hypothetical protein
MTSSPAPDRCPACGGPTGCAITAGEVATTCWCMAAVGSPLPLPTTAAACFCAACFPGRKAEVAAQ